MFFAFVDELNHHFASMKFSRSQSLMSSYLNQTSKQEERREMRDLESVKRNKDESHDIYNHENTQTVNYHIKLTMVNS